MLIVALAAALAGAGCENPFGPSNPWPDVAGFYRGTGSITRLHDGFAVTARTELEVVQLDDTVDTTWTFTWDDDGEVTHMPTQRGVVTADGSVIWPGGFAEPGFSLKCGTETVLSITLRFQGDTARYDERVTTDYCGDYRTEANAER